MSILRRIHRILKAEHTARFSSEEAPVAIREARRTLATVLADERRMRQQYQDLLDEAARLEQLAEKMVEQGNTAAAHSRLMDRERIMREAQDLQRHLLAEQESMLELQRAVESLERRVAGTRPDTSASTPAREDRFATPQSFERRPPTDRGSGGGGEPPRGARSGGRIIDRFRDGVGDEDDRPRSVASSSSPEARAPLRTVAERPGGGRFEEIGGEPSSPPTTRQSAARPRSDERIGPRVDERIDTIAPARERLASIDDSLRTMSDMESRIAGLEADVEANRMLATASGEIINEDPLHDDLDDRFRELELRRLRERMRRRIEDEGDDS